MADPQKTAPTIIKKYANRRLYHTGSSTYVTLDDLGLMVRKGEDFVVTDAKTGEDLTRSVLTQIIFEQENKGQFLLPITFLRQLIQFYGDNMQALVPRYLEFSLQSFMDEQHKLREQMAKSFPATGFGPNPFLQNPFTQNPFTAGQFVAGGGATGAMNTLEEQTRKNMALFQEAMRAFNPFLPPAPTEAKPTEPKTPTPPAKPKP